MFRTITLKTKREGQRKAKRHMQPTRTKERRELVPPPQEPKKRESQSLSHKNQRKERASPSLTRTKERRELVPLLQEPKKGESYSLSPTRTKERRKLVPLVNIHSQSLVFFLLVKFCPKKKIINIKFGKRSDFGGFSHQKYGGKQLKIVRFVYIVPIVSPKIQKDDKRFIFYFWVVARFG